MMPTEIVMLSHTHPTRGDVLDAVGQLHPDATFVELRGGEIMTLVDGEGHGLLTLFPPREMAQVHSAQAELVGPPDSFSIWTDMSIPYGDPADGRATAESIAAAVGGVIRDRA